LRSFLSGRSGTATGAGLAAAVVSTTAGGDEGGRVSAFISGWRHAQPPKPRPMMTNNNTSRNDLFFIVHPFLESRFAKMDKPEKMFFPFWSSYDIHVRLVHGHAA